MSHRILSTLVTATLLLAASAADAALTNSACLAQKRAAWTNLRKCQGTAQAKQIKGKPADLAKCDANFQAKLASIGTKAAKAGIPCRHRDNGDGSVSDFDTGLLWEQKTGDPGGLCFLSDVHCVNNLYDFPAAEDFANQLNGASADGATLTDGFLGHADWRLPTIAELQTIRNATVAGCGSGVAACIDPVFGATQASYYWSSSSRQGDLSGVWLMFFYNGSVTFIAKNIGGSGSYVRAVRVAF